MNRIDALIRAAIVEGVLPAESAVFTQETRPWPVVLLTAVGAWLAVIPLIGVVGLLLGDLISRSAGPYMIGVLLLAGAVVVLRSRDLPLFVEQLAVPALLVGGASIGFGVFRDLPVQGAAFVLAMLALGVAVAVDRPWLRVLMGAALAVLLAMACTPERWGWFSRHGMTSYWFAWHIVAVLTLAAAAAQVRLFSQLRAARLGAALESVVAGMLLVGLAALALWSGMTFMVGASIGNWGAEWTALGTPNQTLPLLQAVSAVLAALGVAWLARHWPAVRQVWCAAAAMVIVALAWFMPSLGAVLLILAVCVVSKRWRIAGAAAVAAAWIIGAFYYRLDWPLATKAILLFAAGALLAALAWLGGRRGAVGNGVRARETEPSSWRSAVGIALTLLAVLAVANIGIWQKEQIIAHGEPVLVEMAPVDPRSLMQGDYMRLAFRMPAELEVGIKGFESVKRPHVVARRDARGVATLLRLDDGSPRAADEMLVELTPKDGRWVLVTDAWFFKEGEAQRWSQAKYGEFRVDSDGKALLVGLRDAQLKPL